MRYSYWGRQIQAVAQNRLGASLAGIDTAKASAIVFALAGGLAALSGALLANIFNPTPDVGVFPAIKSYVIVVLGGMGSVPGSIIASLVLGVLESFGGVYISYQYRDTFGLIILILVLLFRPQGLFGETAARGVTIMQRWIGPRARLRTEFSSRSRSCRWSRCCRCVMANDYWRGVVIVSMYFAMLAAAWNLLAGYTGQFSLAPATFAMIGAYTTGLLSYYSERPPLIGIPAAIVVAGLIGLALGRIVLRLHRPLPRAHHAVVRRDHAARDQQLDRVHARRPRPQRPRPVRQSARLLLPDAGVLVADAGRTLPAAALAAPGFTCTRSGTTRSRPRAAA